MRIAARNEALQTATEQLQLKIQQKVNKLILLMQIRCERFLSCGRFTCIIWNLRDRSAYFYRGGEGVPKDGLSILCS